MVVFMYTISMFKDLVDQVELKYNELMFQYKNDPESFDYSKFNALSYQMAEAGDHLVKGLKGDFGF